MLSTLTSMIYLFSFHFCPVLSSSSAPAITMIKSINSAYLSRFLHLTANTISYVQSGVFLQTQADRDTEVPVFGTALVLWDEIYLFRDGTLSQYWSAFLFVLSPRRRVFDSAVVQTSIFFCPSHLKAPLNGSRLPL